MSNPHVSLPAPDPDPLWPGDRSRDYVEGYGDGWDDAPRQVIHQRPGLLGYVLVALSSALVGALLAVAAVHAAPRPAPDSVVALGTAGDQQERTGAPRAGTAVDAAAEATTEAPAPAGGVGAPLTKEPAAIEAGLASWYDDGPGLYGAVPSWHFGDRPYQVRVTAGGRSVVVTVRDFCGCPGDRVIDLSPSAFAELAPLSAGLVAVTVEDLAPGLTAPPTDLEP